MIEEEKQLFPFCIVWTILPCITWFIPLIGHVGICDSEGVVNDFLGYHINKGIMAFCKPLKYVKLYPNTAQEYDKALNETNSHFACEQHHLCDNNCHHHVAEVLNRLKYQGRQNWSQFDIWWMCVWRSSLINKCYFLKIYLPFVLIVGLLVSSIYGLRKS